jgi:hypothetical protein
LSTVDSTQPLSESDENVDIVDTRFLQAMTLDSQFAIMPESVWSVRS